MYFCTARVMRNAPRRWTFMTVSQSSSLILNSMLSRVTPALLISTVGAPSSAAIRSTAAWTCSASLTSAPTARARPPAASMAWTVFFASASFRSSTATANPSSASRRAVAAPMPRAAPVTTATRAVPASLINVPFLRMPAGSRASSPGARPRAATDRLRAHHLDPVEALLEGRGHEPPPRCEDPDQRHAGPALTCVVALQAGLERGVHPDAPDRDAGVAGGGDQGNAFLGRGVGVVDDDTAPLGPQLGDHPPLPRLTPTRVRPVVLAHDDVGAGQVSGHPRRLPAALEPGHDDELLGGTGGAGRGHRPKVSHCITESRLGLNRVVITWPILRMNRSSSSWRSIASARSPRAVNG